MEPRQQMTNPISGITMEESALEPMERLMLAVLEDAILQFQSGLESRCPKKRRHFHEVGRWFQSSDHDSPFSFESVCDVLRLDPDCLREGLSTLRRTALASAARRPRIRLRRSPIACLPPSSRARAQASRSGRGDQSFVTVAPSTRTS